MFLFRVPYLIQFLFGKRQWKGDDLSCVYFTFDDGPDLRSTEWLLDLLNKENIPSTFFCLGSQIEKHPELYDDIIKKGHAVGNHTYHHEKGSKTSTKNYISSVQKTDALVHSNLFRPPYGRLTKNQMISLKKMDKKIVMWSWNSQDYNKNVSSESILKNAKLIKGGDILLFHNNSKSARTIKQCLPEVIRIIKEKNLKFKTLS
ncbi:MAG: polysaccharide deacetylase family protein [Crocinitomicaceae bacterium]|jgi:peptidoglycan/xylan/chitin deacetylase (PgdA/CDA1 family)|nr:polysaccharide deacetylase family protein [Crocinitomicaceae bacterium]